MIYIKLGLNVLIVWICFSEVEGYRYVPDKCRTEYSSGSLSEPCGFCHICRKDVDSKNKTVNLCILIAKWFPLYYLPFIAKRFTKEGTTFCIQQSHCPQFCKCNNSLKQECVNLFAACKCTCNRKTYGKECEKTIPAGLSRESFADVENIIYAPYIYSTDYAQFEVYFYSTGTNLKIKVETDREQLVFNEKICKTSQVPYEVYCTRLFEGADIAGLRHLCKNNQTYKHSSKNQACSLSINLAFPKYKLRALNKKIFVINYPNNKNIFNIVAKTEVITISIFNEISNISHQIFNSSYGLMIIYTGKSLIEKCNPVVTINQLSLDMHHMNHLTRRQDIAVTSSVVIDEQPLCQTFGEPTLKWFVWIITENHNEKNDLPYLQEEGTYVLEFPSYSLWYGVYKIKFEVILNTNYFSVGTSYCYFSIVSLPLDPIAFGGSLRYIYYKHDLQLITAPLTDPNFPLHEQPKLKYVWYCNDTTDPICKRTQVNNTYNILKMLILILHSPFTPHKAYNFTMEVTSPNTSAVELTNQVIVMSEEPIPHLLIVCLSNCGGKHFKSKVNEILYFRVQHSQLSIPMSKDSVYNWTYSTVKEQDISVENIRQIEETPSWILLIRENVLNNDELYTFKVSGGGEKPGEAQITVKTSPSNISDTFQCTIDPTSGIAGTTKFRVNCTDDGEGQVSFTFYDKSSKDDQTGRLLSSSFTGIAENLILSRGQVSVLSTNIYGQIKETTVTVTLQPVEVTSEFLEKSLTILKTLSLSQGYEQKISFISAVGDVLDKNTTMKQKAMDTFLETISKERASNIVELELVLSTTLSVICYQNNCTMPPMNMQSYQYLVNILSEVTKKLTKLLINLLNNNLELPLEKVHRLKLMLLKSAGVLMNVQDNSLEDKDYSVYKLYKHGNLKIIKSIYKFNNALAIRNLPYTKSSFVQSESIDSYMKEDNPNYFTKLTANRFTRMTPKLAESLNVDFNTITLQIMNLKNNPYWWSRSDPVTTDVLSLKIGYVKRDTDVQNYQQYTPISLLKYPIDIFLKKHNIKNETIHGNVTQLDPTSDPDTKDRAVAVHKMYPPKGAELSVKFVDLNEDDTFMVLIEMNQRPDYDLIFERGINITALSPWYNFPKGIVNEDDFIFIGILPGSNVAVGSIVNYKFEIQSALCQVWYDVAWSTSGCKLGNESTEEQLHCQCNHLSFISGLLKVPMNTVNPFEDYKLFLTVPENPYVFALISTMLIVYFILSIWSFKHDREDYKKTNLIILEDNISSDLFGYLLIVCTGSRLFAGTSSNIGIILHGTQFSSRSHILKSSKRATLKKGSDDWFLLYTPEYLGIISSVQLWTDHSGPTPNWFCGRIYIHDLLSKDDYAFEVGQWFGITQLEICMEKFVRPITFEKDTHFSAYFLTNAISGFRESHLLVSVLWAYPRSPVLKSQRLSMIMVSILVTLLTSIMFYNVAIPQVEDVPSYQITFQEVLISVYSLMIAAVITSVVAFTFKKSYVKKKVSKNHNIQVKSQRKIKVDRLREGKVTRQSERNLIVYYLHKTILTLRKQNFYPIKSGADKNEYMGINKTRAVLAWVFCLTVIVITSYFIILYGLKFGKVKSLLWLTSIGMSFGQDNIVIDPLKIMMISALFGIVEAQFCDMYTYNPNIHEIRTESNVKIEIDQDIKKHKLRLKPYYKHIGRKRLKSIQMQQRKIQKWWTLMDIVDICFPGLFIFIVVFWYSQVYYNNSLFDRVHFKYTQSYNIYESLPKILNGSRYLQQVVNIILPEIYSTVWYNKLSLTSELEAFENTGWTADATNRIMGIPRFRQIRVRKQYCNVPQVLYNLSAHCNVQYSSTTEDTKSYGTFWKGFSSDDIMFSESPWTYHSFDNTSSITIYGESGRSYHGGGYLAKLSRTQTMSENIIFKLIDTKWLNWRTHVVFLEMTTYNANINAFTSIIFLAEILERNLILESIQIMSFFPRNDYILFEMLGFIYGILGITKLIMVFNTIGMSFFLYFWPMCDLILIVIGVSCLIGYRLFLINASIYIRSFEKTGKDTFFQFQKLFISLNTTIYLLMILFIFINLRLLRLIYYGNGKISRKQIRAIYSSWHEILWVTLMLVLLMIGIQHFLFYFLCDYFHIQYMRNLEPFDKNVCPYLPYSLLNLAVFIYILIICKSYTRVSKLQKEGKNNSIQIKTK